MLNQGQWDKLLRLRGFLAFYVLLHHVRNVLWPRLHEIPSSDQPLKYTSLVVNILGEWGLFAVLAFFVVSGFSIGIAYRRTFQISQFWKSRLRRLYPAFLFSIATTAAFYFLVHGQFHGQGINLLATLSLQNGLTFGGEFGDNGPYWSLACEGLYYLLFPLLFFGNYGFQRIFWISLASLAVFLLLEPTKSVRAFLYLPVWLAGLYASFRANHHHLKLTVLSIAALAAGLLAYIYCDAKDLLSLPVELSIAVISGIAIAPLIISLIHFPWSLPFARIRHFLGDISYSLYIVHYPVLWWIATFFAKKTLINSLTASLVAILASIAIATLAYHFFEKPFLKKRA